MRVVVAIVVAALAVAVARAEEGRARRGADLDVIVPVDPHEHARIYWFGRRTHHLLPGTVTIDEAGYVCDVDRRRFRRQDEFIAHLRLVHRVPVDQIPDRVVLTAGQVHFPVE